jgi:hypothetical protein
MRAAPRLMRVSLSGFNQQTYAHGHAEGDIETVKQNMIRLAEAKKATNNTETHLQVYYHQYVDNFGEMTAMAKFAAAYGYEFQSTLARIFPVEKIMTIAAGHVTPEDRILLDRLALPLDRALAVAGKAQSCELLDDMMILDVNGDAMLCCTTTMERKNNVGNFLELPLVEIQSRRRQMQLCSRCLDMGIPNYFHGTDEYPAIAAETYAASREANQPSKGPHTPISNDFSAPKTPI